MMACMAHGLKDLRDRALILIGFAGAFRRPELVAITCGVVERVPQGIVVQDETPAAAALVARPALREWPAYLEGPHRRRAGLGDVLEQRRRHDAGPDHPPGPAHRARRPDAQGGDQQGQGQGTRAPQRAPDLEAATK